MFGSSNRTIIQTQTSETTKMGHWAQNQASAMTIPVLWPEPCRKWVRWTEEKHQHGAGNLKGLEWFWMKEWSLISCQMFSNLIRHYRRTFRPVKLANGGFKKYWIKGGCHQLWLIMCIRHKHLFHNDICPHFKFLISNKRLDIYFFLYKIKRINNADTFFTALFDHIYQGCQYFWPWLYIYV